MKLFDRKGKPVEVPDDQVPEALSSGAVGAPAGTRIPVRMDGTIGTVPIEKLTEALSSGAEVVPQSAYEAAELQAQYGDAKGKALAGTTEFLNTATLGASDAAIGAVASKDFKRDIRKSREANPLTTGVATGLGIAAPIAADILSGGALTPELAAAAAERAAVRGAEGAAVRGAEGGIARQLMGAGERRLLGAGERAAVDEAAALARAEAPAARGPVIEGVLEDAPRRLPPTVEEMLGEVVPNAQGLPGQAPHILPSNALVRQPRVIEGVLEEVPRLPQVAPEIEAEVLRSVPLPPGRAPRALPPASAEFEALGAQAAKDAPEIAQVVAPRPPPVAPVAPEVAAAEEAARAERLAEAAQVVEEARAAGKAAERAAAEATGKGVVRQTVETALFGPTRMVNGAGEAVEGFVRGVIGREAETALGRIAQDAIVKGARGAMEGGIYGLGNEVGHQFLQDDPDLSAERLKAAWFNGALLGGGFGAATGALGRGAKEAIDRVVGNEGIAKFLSDKAGEHMWHAAGGTKTMTAQAEKYAGGTAKVGNLIRQDAEQLMGRTPRTREEMAELAGLMLEKHNKSLDAVLNRLDDGTANVEMRLKDVIKHVEKFENELKDRAAPRGPLTKFKEDIIEALEARDPLTGDIDLNKKLTFKQLREFRRTADEASKFESTNPNAVREAFRQVRHAFESEIESAAEPLLNKAGGSLLKDYKLAKAGYQAGKMLERASASGVAAGKTNQFYSLTDKIFGIGAGAVVGHATGPLGGFVSHSLAGYASKQFRKNFDFVVSDVLAKLANVAKGAHVLDAAQAANEKVQRRMDQGMRSVRKGLEGKEVGEMPLVPGPKTFEERREVLLNLAAQQEEVVAHLQSTMSPLARAAPNVAASFHTATLRTLVYLMDALPKPPKRPNSLTPQLVERDWQPSDPQKTAFNRKWDMAVHPELAPSLVAAGKFMPEHAQSLQANHPKMQEAMATELRASLEKSKKPVPARMQTSVKLALGVPLVGDKSLGRTFQVNYAPRPVPQSGAQPTLTRPLKLSQNPYQP